MAVHFIQIRCQEQLDQVRAEHATMVLFLDNVYDSACQRLRAPLLKKCQEMGRLLVAVPSPAPVDATGKSGLPFVSIVVEADIVASLYEPNIDKLWAGIEQVDPR